MSIPAQVQFQAHSRPAVTAPTTYQVSPLTTMAAPSVPPAVRELRGEFEAEMEGLLDWEHMD